MDAFDADVLIYAAAPGHPLGDPVRALFAAAGDAAAGIGSVLLIPELLSKPIRDEGTHEVEALTALLGRLELLPATQHTATVAASLGAQYRLRAVEAVHLATATLAGADRFITNTSSDFTSPIAQIEILTPRGLT